MTIKVIEGHKISSYFSINPTLPLLDGPLMLLSPNHVDLSLSLSLSLAHTFFLILSPNVPSSLIAFNANLWMFLSLFYLQSSLKKVMSNTHFY